MLEITFLPAADADFQEALAYYQERSLQAADGFEAAVEVALRAVAQNPELWPRCDPRHRIYSLRRYPFSLIYRVETDSILVVAVAHSRRSANFWKDRS